MTAGRLLAMIVKELWATLRDPRARITLILPPILQLVLFSAAATLEVKNVTVGVWDRDGGAASAEFVAQLAGSPNVKRIVVLDSSADLRAAIDDQRVLAAVVIDETFSRDLAAGRPATVQAILDGRKSNAAQIFAGYLNAIAASVGATLRPATASAGGETVVANAFNPSLNYLWFIMPALLVQISSVSALSVTAQSVARERELGTFDQLMVSPLRLHEILIGKMTPPFLIGMFNGTLYLIVIPLLYGVPFAGSILLFYLAQAVFLLAIIGIGMLVSAVSQTQQQAFLGMFLVTVPAILLSGFTTPFENMPGWLQVVGQADPVKHFMVISEGLFLKAMPASDVFANLWPLALIAAVTLTGATLLFRSRME
ncbi:ABC-2 type transport system permease protein [Sphingomonas sp. UYAg733]